MIVALSHPDRRATAERDSIIDRLRPANPAEGSEAELRQMLSLVRQRGYATRDPMLPWPDRSKQLVLRDGRRSMAVPIMVDGSPIATINVTWPGRRGADEAVVNRHLEALKATARAIGEALAKNPN